MKGKINGPQGEVRVGKGEIEILSVHPLDAGRPILTQYLVTESTDHVRYRSRPNNGASVGPHEQESSRSENAIGFLKKGFEIEPMDRCGYRHEIHGATLKRTVVGTAAMIGNSGMGCCVL